MGKIIYNKGFKDLISKKTVAPTITFIEKNYESITVSFTNNSASEATISYGLTSPPNDDTVVLASSETSDNVVISGLDDNTSHTIFASANGTPENVIESEFVSITPTTDPLPEVFVYSGSEDNTVRKIDADGNQVWSFTGHTGYVNDIDADDNGNVYTASEDKTIRKIDSNGNQVWSNSYTARTTGVRVDKDGFVYTSSYDGNVRKLDNNGNQIWTYTGYGGDIFKVRIDTVGNVYMAYRANEIRKLDSSGQLVLTITNMEQQQSNFDIDLDGNIYAKGSDKITKHDSNGNLVNSTNMFSHPNNIELDGQGHVFATLFNGDSFKFDLDLNLILQKTDFPSNFAAYAMSVDLIGNVYYGISNDDIIKANSNLDAISWTFTGHTDSIRAVQAYPAGINRAL